MNKDVAISIETANTADANWFKRHLYRKEGEKYVLDVKRFRLLFVAIALLALLFVSLQPTPYEKSPSSSNQGVSTTDLGIYQFPEFDYSQIENLPPLQQNFTPKKSSNRKSGPQVIARPKIAIPPASTLSAVLISGVSDGVVRARLLSSLTINGETAIEEGTIVAGTASSTDDRLLISFTKLIDKDGGIRSIQAQAYDKKDNLAGIPGGKLKSNALRLAGSLGLNFLGAASEVFQDREGQQGVLVKKSSLKNALLEGASRTALDQSRDIMSDLKNSRPQIKVEQGLEIFVVFGSY